MRCNDLIQSFTNAKWFMMNEYMYTTDAATDGHVEMAEYFFRS
jgi:hypothetical protein